MPSLSDDLKTQAHQLGFELVGITPASPPPTHASFLEWLSQGYAGEMEYLEKHKQARSHPESILPGAKSIIMLGISYHQPELRNAPVPPLHGKIASYALGSDYHQILWDKVNSLADWLKSRQPAAATRGIVDTAPLLERDYARMAGLGWFGKNTMLINKHQGSFFFIASLLTDLTLDYDQPHLPSHCGTCTACLDACPTQAFPEPGKLDATRCISYLTIELKGPVLEEHKKDTGHWLFGCDICQDVCPWNRKAPAGKEPALLADKYLQSGTLNLLELFTYTPEQWRLQFRHTALWRAKRNGLLRNACLVLGNEMNMAAYPHLKQAMQDEDEGVRDAATWACRRMEETLDAKTACSSVAG